MSKTRDRAAKIPVDASGPLSRNPFASLSLEGLPPGPASVEPAPRANEPDSEAKKGRVILRREKSGRAGKVVTVIDGLEASLDEVFLQRLAKEARQFCGCGGTLKERTIELQGDQADRVKSFLTGQGFRVVGP